MSAHTPGPWSWRPPFYVEGDDVGRQFKGIDGPGDEYVLEYANCGSHEVWVDNPADARLIIAAPDLLEALLELWSVRGFAAAVPQGTIERVRAAIAKARGES